MQQLVRTIVFNTDEECKTPLRQHLLAIEGVKVVAEIDEPGMLPATIDRIPADLLVAHLDPNPKLLLPMAAEVATQHPEVAVFAISAQADGDLILVALRAGLREFLVKPVDPEQLSAAVDKVRTHMPESQRTGQLVCLFGGAGGVGATTLSANLAVELNQLVTGKVAVVDLDFRHGQLATCFDLQPTYTIADLCDTAEQLEPQMIGRAMFEHESGVHVLARPNQMLQAEQITAAHCVSVLSSLQEMYEYVVVDGPSRFDPCAQPVLDLADLSLLVLQLLVTDVRNTHRILEDLSARGYNMDRVKVVCNRDARDTGRLEPEHVSATLNRDFFAVIPNDWAAVSGALNIGVPLITESPRSRARLAIKELAEKIVGGDAVTDGESKSASKGGVLSKLFS
jgi:pilus assembly protein CpaE